MTKGRAILDSELKITGRIQESAESGHYFFPAKEIKKGGDESLPVSDLKSGDRYIRLPVYDRQIQKDKEMKANEKYG